MSKVVTPGKQQKDGSVILLGGEGGLNKIRCPKCKRLAPMTARPDGRRVYKCTACGAEFTQTRM